MAGMYDRSSFIQSPTGAQIPTSQLGQALASGVSTSGRTSTGGLLGTDLGAHDVPLYTAENVHYENTSDRMNAMLAAEQQRLMRQGQINMAPAAQLGQSQAGPMSLTQFNQMKSALGRAPTAADVQGGGQSSFAPVQVASRGVDKFNNTLSNWMNGSGPTAADAQFKQATNANLNSALALAASAPGHGGNYAAAMRQAMNQNAMTTQNAALQAGQLRAQEQQGAAGMLGQSLQAQRAQDIGLAQGNQAVGLQAAMSNAQLQQQANLAQYQGSIQQQQGLNDRMMQLMKAGMGVEQAQYQAQVEQRQFNASLLAQQQAAAEGVGVGLSGQAMTAAGGAASGLGSVLSSWLA